MGIRGVLFDYSGTLFRLEPAVDGLTGFIDADGADLGRDRLVELLGTMTLPVGVPPHLPADQHDAWHRRDLDPALHRSSYEASLGSADLALGGDVPARLYDLMLRPSSWRPYPDTAAALRGLRDRGVPVAVLSNIAWDIRETFAEHGLDGLVDEFVLSYAEGLVKPDPEVFRLACARIGVEPAAVLMVGDSAEADGGSVAIGCRFERVAPLPTAERPDALVGALGAHGL